MSELDDLIAERDRRSELAALQAEQARRAAAPADRGNVVSRGFESLANADFAGPPITNPRTQFFDDIVQSNVTSAGDTPIDVATRNAARLGRAAFSPNALPRLAEGAVNAVGAIGRGIAEDPVQTLIVDPASQTGKIAPNLMEVGPNIAAGQPGAALANIRDAATAAGETALLIAAPGSTAAARQVGKQALKETGGQLLDDFARAGVDPTIPAVFPQTAGRVAKPLSENAFFGVTLRSGADDVIAQSERALRSSADAFSDSAGPLDAGQAAIAGSRAQLRAARPRSQASNIENLTFREKARNVYDAAFARIDESATHSPAATKEILGEINARFDNAALQDLFKLRKASQLEAIVSDAGELSIRDLRNMRTSIRELQNQSVLTRTVDDAALERLEGALTKDIFAAVGKSSGEDVGRQLRQADRFYRRNITSIRKALKPFLGENVTQEQAFRSIVLSARGQGRGNIRQLRAMRRSLTPQQMDDVSSGVLREMGKGKEGSQFSPEVFAREWQNMGSDAKRALFDRAKRPEVRENLDALARTIERQARVEGLANRSQSAVSGQNVLTAGGILAAPVTSISVIAGANGFGRLMMSPTFTKALVQLQQSAPRAASPGFNVAREKARMLAILAAVENTDKAIAPMVRDLRATIEASNDNLLTQSGSTALQ